MILLSLFTKFTWLTNHMCQKFDKFQFGVEKASFPRASQKIFGIFSSWHLKKKNLFARNQNSGDCTSIRGDNPISFSFSSGKQWPRSGRDCPIWWLELQCWRATRKGRWRGWMDAKASQILTCNILFCVGVKYFRWKNTCHETQIACIFWCRKDSVSFEGGAVMR